MLSQKQAIIILIEKKDRDRRFFEDWRSISLPNFDYKIVSEALATCLIFLTLITHQQKGYVQNNSISETVRLISDILVNFRNYKPKI